MIPRTHLLVAGALAATLAFSQSAAAETVRFTADLTAGAEVPPATSPATGTVEAELDTDSNVFSWNVSYDGLTGDATAAHFHGPAPAGANAPPIVPIEGALASPIVGTVTLTPEQVSSLQAGEWYFNVHTAQFPDGEIRGQLARQQ